jgi:hypothetical protein
MQENRKGFVVTKGQICTLLQRLMTTIPANRTMKEPVN